jgi:carotenoid cleavage dioxygenase
MLADVANQAARTNLAPIPMEWDAPNLTVIGELPRELNGTLYRNGPNPQFEAPGAHWFVGDGMLHAFHLENGRASYGRPSMTPAAPCSAASAASCRMRPPR